MSDEPPVIVEKRGRVGHILLNRPRAINALNSEMVALIASALDEWEWDADVQTVLITGAGERGLCAGGDIVSIYRDALQGNDGSERFWRAEYRLNARIARYPKPYVALQDGIVLGGGIGISAHGSVRIVTERSRLGMPETGIGFVPDVGGTYILSRSPGELGTHLALTAGQIGAADAIVVGFADHFVPSARLDDFAEALETDDVDAAVTRFAEEAPAGALAGQRAWIDDAYAGDHAEAILERLRNLPDSAAYDSVAAKSPTSIKATLSALRRARELPDLGSVLEQDLRVALSILHEPDFVEGVRAQVIDKDRTPHWSPATLAEVDDRHIESLFSPLGGRELGVREEPRTEIPTN